MAGVPAVISLNDFVADEACGGALPEPVADHGDCAPMRLDYGSGDGQSQAGAAYATTARLVSPVEAVEDVGKVRLSVYNLTQSFRTSNVWRYGIVHRKNRATPVGIAT